MGIKIAEINDSGKKLVPIRRLMVQENGKNVEKYRVVCGGKLIYGKGMVNFDWNIPSFSNLEIPGVLRNGDFAEMESEAKYIMPSHLYVFYKDGLFHDVSEREYSHEKWERFRYLSFDDNKEITSFKELTKESINHTISAFWLDDKYNLKFSDDKDPIYNFKGWYYYDSKKKQNISVDSFQEIQTKTPLFKYKTDNSLPTITLKGHWEFIKYRVTFHNILRNNTRSSFVYYDPDKKKKIRTNGTFSVLVPYGTSHSSIFNKFIKEKPKYQSWAAEIAENYLNTSKERKKLKTPLISYGWSGGSPDKIIRSNVNFYPLFDAICIFEKTFLPSGKFFNGTVRKIPRSKLIFAGVLDAPWYIKNAPFLNNDGNGSSAYHTRTYIETIDYGYYFEQNKVTEYYNWEISQWNSRRYTRKYHNPLHEHNPHVSGGDTLIYNFILVDTDRDFIKYIYK